LRGLAGAVPDLITPPPGCRFAPRCERASEQCRRALPPSIELAAGHSAACVHLHD
ncbi:MAG: ABC transporter ATP-binding protein, partial [Alphaproteobacteria bacterium]|nr:ABC transporter ATP-binding protein [Alphaproteobacteria bacterium]